MLGDLLTPPHLIVLGIVGLLIFGPKRLPELGSGLGQAFRGFKNAINGDAAVEADSLPVSQRPEEKT
ncbi:MAG: twin-arginine translocase TatA/TatE family subunit [Firmicutes bacterium]|jgi:sec-independent protein translocase protein TatA|uniref:Sec-independent protein translocase protein TatA n=1 Tax=Sulfobacillus benefaciens TaxID=453960 RepID=A0A2T2X9Y8_9FIRM|nr:twin-arginine translocase TatA/TatE family subunit [Bacillota bacterium]MCL5015350.1 twin-arginine translocase TatA/TatE family subunit [Bacillota bacterium]PSR31331.1 MAG: twin-arginine translocase TatA/TatE family subunit [Sulfobacillus benefaciens]HBQ95029.1 twin-arginine translocase TatA/TatE family subunit [Sulfobacillus sp.]